MESIQFKLMAIIQKINFDEKYPTLREIVKLSPIDKKRTLSVLLELERTGLVDSGDVKISKGNWARVWVLEDVGLKIIEKEIKNLKKL